MHIGNFIRIQRTARNYSLTDLSNGIMTKSSLSRFERGLIDISSETFFRLLDRLNISMHEMKMYLTHAQNSNLTDFITEYSFARKDNNKYLLQKLFEKEINLYESTHNIRHQHNAIIVSQKLLQLNQTPFDTTNTSIIISYLHSLNEWYYYEIALFSNALFFLPSDQVDFFSRDILEKSSKISRNKIFLQEIVLTVMNIIYNFISNEQIFLALKIVKSLEDYLQGSTYYYEINKLNFLKGICFIKSNRKEEGIELAKKSLSLMYDMHDYTNVRVHQDYMDEILNSMS